MAFGLTANAQQWSVALRGGLQGLQYKVDNAKINQQAGGGIHIGYRIPVKANWQLLTGVGADYYSTRATLSDNTSFQSNEIDAVGSGFQYSVETVGYEEKLDFFALTVPLTLQYEASGKNRWQANGGVKFVLPFRASLEARADQLTQSAYYPDYNLTVEDLPQHGFGTTNNWTDETKRSLNAGIAATAGIGYGFDLGKKWGLSLGLFADYGLTNMRKEESQGNAVYYNNGKARAAGTINMVDNVRLMAFGLQVRLSLLK